MHELPVNSVLPEIKENLKLSSRLVLQAPPGAGKTTLVPIALLDQPWLGNKKIIMLEPRRLAARNAAGRMAYLLGEKVGQRVGYQIRADRCVSSKTQILVVTEGILTRLLQDDPSLEDFALVIFDEFHERNLRADLSLAFCLQSQELLREELKILLMSATLNSQALSQLLGDAPIVYSEGRSYPVKNKYLEPGSQLPERHNIVDIICQIIEKNLSKHSGNFLVFLPGVREIKLIEECLDNRLKQSDIEIAPLFGDLTQREQDKAIIATKGKQRKIVLATNIAETSLTIDGISVVIDSGLQRISIFNPRLAMNHLKTEFISQDSADQRSGRAGRLGPGYCYRLWTESKQGQLVKHHIPEVLYSDLSPLVLEMAKWGVYDINELIWLDQPSTGAIAQARDLLCKLQALGVDGRITPQGELMLMLGLHPRLAHMLISAVDLGFAYQACILAALLSEKDIFKSQGKININLAERMQILLSLANKNTDIARFNANCNKKQSRLVLKTADLYYQRLKKGYKQGLSNRPKASQNDSFLNRLGVLLAYAYPDRIAQCRNKGQGRYLMSSGKGAYIDTRAEFWDAEYIVIADLDGNQQGKEARIYLCAEISMEQLHEHFSHLMIERQKIQWNRKLERVEASKQLQLNQLTISKNKINLTTSEIVSDELIHGIKELGLGCLNWSKKAQGLKQRIDFLNYQKINNPGLNNVLMTVNLPNLSDDYLFSHLGDWLGPYLDGLGSIKQVQQLDFYQIFIGQVDWPQQQLLEELAPIHIQVASGSNITIDYSDKEKPTLAVKLQELFGTQQTPSVIKGQFKLLLHLLSPAMRPMQVTEDLNNFWRNTYPEVKKELQGKYKKHYWPDDPVSAKATNKIKRFMNK